MSFIRPAAKQAIWRWREVLLGLGLACLGMYWAVSQQGLMAAVGTGLVILGALFLFAGFQRTRFRVGTGGPGVVQVDEREITYFGPFEGGTISTDALVRVELDPAAKPHAVWVLTDASGITLSIPTQAENAEALFDVFASLDGIRTENMLAKLRERPHEKVNIWSQPERRLH
ncbi:hypothetical protein [Pseudoruegeria sp. HB172150]|uniref:hypothetical protein n=1 Tax=Pseudoruegeria sp. HB172150 TaxID=2721164 RepID=UPI001556FCC9|nr:hypothetical protein [Pseudoruegeria sp. HB172150]